MLGLCSDSSKSKQILQLFISNKGKCSTKIIKRTFIPTIRRKEKKNIYHNNESKLPTSPFYVYQPNQRQFRTYSVGAWCSTFCRITVSLTLPAARSNGHDSVSEREMIIDSASGVVWRTPSIISLQSCAHRRGSVPRVQHLPV